MHCLLGVIEWKKGNDVAMSPALSSFFAEMFLRSEKTMVNLKMNYEMNNLHQTRM